MLYIDAARNGFRSHEISNIFLVRSVANLYYGLKKPMVQAALRNFIQSFTHTPYALNLLFFTHHMN